MAGWLLLWCASSTLQAQTARSFLVADSSSREPLPGVLLHIKGTNTAAITNDSGRATLMLHNDSTAQLVVHLIGYTDKTMQLYPVAAGTITNIFLVSDTRETEVVEVSSSRSNARLENLPVKVEVLGTEEMDEENAIKPANVASILGDLSVIHIQTVNASSGNVSVRMQGLDGKYTQILRDGLPLFSGFAGGFGVLQMPPLDVKQVEIIKGSASTLYGGGAIGGLINVISKAPDTKPEFSITLNRSSLTENNVNGYFANRNNKAGVTVYGGITKQGAVDVNKDGFSDAPQIMSYVLHPVMYLYFNKKLALKAGLNTLSENRKGGDMQVIQKGADSVHSYSESIRMNRVSAEYQLTYHANAHSDWTLKGCSGFFTQEIQEMQKVFQGTQVTHFVEVNDVWRNRSHTWVWGGNLSMEAFVKKADTVSAVRNFQYLTKGLFVQDNWQVHPLFLIQAGLRADFHSSFGNFFLPSLALLYKPSPAFNIRLSGGSGYKTPNVFSMAGINYFTIDPPQASVMPEKSYSANGDINYNTLLFHAVSLHFDQAFYFTSITHPALIRNAGQRQEYYTSNVSVQSTGADSYCRLHYRDFELYLGYNHTIARFTDQKTHWVPYSPQDKYSTTMMYEVEEHWRFGIENSRVANQYRDDGTKARNYWFWAALVQYSYRSFTVVLNCEDVFDMRQSRFENIITGPVNNPVFKPLYAPIEGRVVNLSVRGRF